MAATLSDRDAEVVVLLDVLAEAGRSGGVGGAASVLDTTVRAAAAIAEHYLHRGDRVSMLEYGPGARRLRPAAGRRQYLTVLEWLLDVRAEHPRTSRTTRCSVRRCCPRTRWWWCSPRCWTSARRRCWLGWPAPAGSWWLSTPCRPT
ncbi:hypothetical protein GCM10027614_37870 [Micromonospora vulcania]